MQDAGQDTFIRSAHEAPSSSSTLSGVDEDGAQRRLLAAPHDSVAVRTGKRAKAKKSERADARTDLMQTQCLKLGLSILSRPSRQVRSIGFTSAMPGEGKSALAILTATALADQGQRSVTIVDSNWDAPTLHSHYDVPATPGLAEWLRHECSLERIRHSISPRLTVIPAGDGRDDPVALTDALKATGARSLLVIPEESLIVDMAPILTTSYGALLAQEIDAVLLVVRAGVTWDSYVQEACQELAASAVEGVVLNATHSRIPRWLQRVL